MDGLVSESEVQESTSSKINRDFHQVLGFTAVTNLTLDKLPP